MSQAMSAQFSESQPQFNHLRVPMVFLSAVAKQLGTRAKRVFGARHHGTLQRQRQRQETRGSPQEDRAPRSRKECGRGCRKIARSREANRSRNAGSIHRWRSGPVPITCFGLYVFARLGAPHPPPRRPATATTFPCPVFQPVPVRLFSSALSASRRVCFR